MFAARIFKAMPARASAFPSVNASIQSRFMATVRNGRVAHERATFTIRDGPIFHGKSFGARSNISGEAVFTTSLVGYPESLTDPSYRGQILVFTQPLIGNYGVPSTEKDQHGLLKYFESPHLQAAGVVVADVAEQYSHWTAVQSLGEWCAREGVPAISGVDTRAIVTYLLRRDQDEAFVDPEQIHLVRQVSTKAPFHVSAADPQCHVAVLDCGVKENILRSLVSRGASITVFPFDYPIHKVAHHFDGVFISNGPGDPTHCQETAYHLRRLMETSQVPIFGICLGHQLLALAIGARTIKLKYGNRAHNIPALDMSTGRCHITSQNHGYAVDASTLPSDWKPYFVNLNDSSNEGMIHKTRPIFSTQFHPEAKGGPLDSSYLFDIYLDSVRKYKASQSAFHPTRDSLPSPLLVDLLAKERVGVQPTIGMQNVAAAAAVAAA
ncbi:carbamoyl-phosphate synthase arginine-specific small chain [Aspergillus nomiae NRRL 13137]|uniref:Carbamoyl phosphate synthase arginine-specific small chain n=1 Tax=Aspergillus nomiae NRRL (strain ATCC 15546 / NRRL 13137 / CBS 260.88 / M93) TaxID=1509407 RepID=A0A0L1IT34_ASPN3|nr:carbamoyl-phosphate synthase arginine-specific small chain [Aspergillus nomiae NRRL 13137]KNG82644.1 carbamoyl-phosphate synthase arginine-specific small chain [Aspergillus nomiae NRRL 13137]